MVLVLFLGACQQQWVYDAERNQRALASGQYEEMHYNVPPQVVYRIDDHRFVTLEKYNHCLGYAWYDDTKTGVRTKIGLMWVTGFRGRLIIDDPTGMNVALPTVSRNVCGDRGCIDYVAYSSNGGRTFDWVSYENYHTSFDPVADSNKYIISVTKEAMYITMFKHKYIPPSPTGESSTPTYDLLNDAALTDRYPLAPGYVYGKDAKLPEGVQIQAGVTLPSALRTPSGADHFTCDETIRDPKATE
jgi:hypothetical protein